MSNQQNDYQPQQPQNWNPQPQTGAPTYQPQAYAPQQGYAPQAPQEQPKDPWVGIAGTVVRDAETRTTAQGQPLTSFTLVQNNIDNSIRYVKITVWGGESYYAAYIKKGDVFAAWGFIKNNTHTDKSTREVKDSWEISAKWENVCGKRKAECEQQYNAYAAQFNQVQQQPVARAEQQSTAVPAPVVGMEDIDLPF